MRPAMTRADADPPPAVGARILVIDEHIVVVDKPAGMPSAPARTPSDPPCVAAVLAPVIGPVEPVHRLDRDTSGLLVLARHAAARAALGTAFESRQVTKRYQAVVHGRPPPESGIVHLPLAPDPYRPPRYRVDPILGRASTSRWRLLHAAVDRQLAWLELEPLTGRSHQLRAHLAWMGMPIVDDRLYGRGPAAVAGPMRLRASRLVFPHPVGGGRVEVEAEAAAWWSGRSP